MMNMSYCRFQNTANDLDDCAEGITDDLSPDEHVARRRLIRICREIVMAAQDNEWIEESLEDGKEFA